MLEEALTLLATVASAYIGLALCLSLFVLVVAIGIIYSVYRHIGKAFS